MFKRKCRDCDLPFPYHLQTWLEEATGVFPQRLHPPAKFSIFIDVLIEKLFVLLGLFRIKEDFRESEIQARSVCFIEEARKRGVRFKAIKGPFGYTNRFHAELEGKIVRFEGLPAAEHLSKRDISFIDCKERTRNFLKKGGFPFVEGKSFWFWQRSRAIKYGAGSLGFPLVVKPRGGSVARHVTTDIRNGKELGRAIDRAVAYSPAFVIERFIKDSFVHRVTVVDFNYIACVKQVPANVVGDGEATVRELIKIKNKDEGRGLPDQRGSILHGIVIDETSEKLLREQGLSLEAVPSGGEVVYLQKDPFLRLGGDLSEVSDMIHPDNTRLFEGVAKFFDIRLVGIDFIAPDISLSWRDQPSAILELNSIPCIELHHFPTSGISRNATGSLVELFFKYYLQ